MCSLAVKFITAMVLDMETRADALALEVEGGKAMAKGFLRVAPKFGQSAAPSGLYGDDAKYNPTLRPPHVTTMPAVFAEHGSDLVVAGYAVVYLRGAATELRDEVPPLAPALLPTSPRGRSF
jgi:hypothetical protein